VSTFTISSNDPDITFRAFFGDGPAVITDGYGGWTVQSRAKDVGYTDWQGRNPMAIEIPFVIDNIRNLEDGGIKTEDMVRKLERLSGIGSHDVPPICRVNGGGAIPHDNTAAPGYHRWVVENISWDRAIEYRSGTSKRRMRCGGTITIRQYLEPDALDRLASKRRAKKKKRRKSEGKSSGRSRTYIVRSGDTLPKIAVKFYHDANKWRRIADTNNLRDPNHIEVGQRLRIP